MDSIIVPLMNRLFGDVFANIERDQLELTLWNGKVQFKDLVLNAGVLIKQGIPLQIVRGKIANLTLDIPWKELTAKPLTVGLEGLSLELKIAPDHYDPDLDFEIEQAYKKSRLSRNECLPDPVQDTYSSRLVNAAISNLNVLIRNVLIKFQDIDGRNVVESEFSMNALSIATCGPDFFQGASKETSPIANVIYKLIKLTDVAISCQRFELGKMTLESQNLIAPVSGQGNLKLSKTASPIYDFEILLDNFGVICTDQQLQILLNIVDSIHRKSRRKAHLRHRPPESVPVKLDPKAWFQYSVKSILQDIQAKNREWSWTHFKERRDQRRAYISLYRKYLSNECFPEEISQLEEFETILALEDILWYRQVAAKGLSPMPKTRSSKWFFNIK